jgi:hypothetical protein
MNDARAAVGVAGIGQTPRHREVRFDAPKRLFVPGGSARSLSGEQVP